MLAFIKGFLSIQDLITALDVVLIPTNQMGKNSPG